MDWLESIQKVAPWAGSLPVIHKLVLSAIISGIGVFSLLLIWLPAPSPEPKTERPITPLTIFVDSSGAAAEAATKFAQQLSTRPARENLERRVEKEKLKRVIRNLVSIETSQSPLPWLLRGYAKANNAELWPQVALIISMNTPIISELADVLQEFDGDLIFRDIETYRQLRFMVATRAGLYEQLANMPPPTSPAEREQLLRIADNFEILIKQMKHIQKNLSDYLKAE